MLNFILAWLKEFFCCRLIIIIVSRRVARIWKRGGGGAFLKEWEKCKWPWPEFSLFLNQFHTVFPKIETKFLGKLGNSNVFSAQKQVVSKKKRSSPKLRLIFGPKLEIQTLFHTESSHLLLNFGTQFPLGGLFSIFHQKSASKAPKTCDVAYFTTQWGGSSPPAPSWLRYWLLVKSANKPITGKLNKTLLIQTSERQNSALLV